MPKNEKPTGGNGGLEQNLTTTSDGNTKIIAESGSEVNSYDAPLISTLPKTAIIQHVRQAQTTLPTKDDKRVMLQRIAHSSLL